MFGCCENIMNFFTRRTSDTSKTYYRLHVVTGDKRGAGTDANVYVILHDAYGRSSPPLSLNKVFRNDNERGSTTSVDVKEDCGIAGPLVKVEVWRDNFADLSIFGNTIEFLFSHRTKRGSSAWFLDRIEVEEIDVPQVQEQQQQHMEEELVTVHQGSSGGTLWVFPLQRWVEAHRHYDIHLHDCFLPQFDPNAEDRKKDLYAKRQDYTFDQKVEDGPVQVTFAASCLFLFRPCTGQRRVTKPTGVRDVGALLCVCGKAGSVGKCQGPVCCVTEETQVKGHDFQWPWHDGRRTMFCSS
ncbi:hypothetical protein GWK47_027623 [Chionoecetes opilio]|uniref:PLAT domain-containing protein n=1 Tax=Chionoecetes opilio TaxID=41210 RepID=A0A8J8WNE7_CHIOP|nr:hypothetical protein GWK47_027623 [Chionoecetes opilio]